VLLPRTWFCCHDIVASCCAHAAFYGSSCSVGLCSKWYTMITIKKQMQGLQIQPLILFYFLFFFLKKTILYNHISINFFHTASS
jgi:hypothetical protein